ncbi:MAG TPA: hypothetical protein VHO69_11185 [Phototrophicaceae bacterium]|nr:hypothetical protein [Phototrophicaceae bacterium]
MSDLSIHPFFTLTLDARGRVMAARRVGAEAGVSLRQRRRWFDETGSTEGDNNEGNDAPPAGALNTSTNAPVPYDRFQQVYNDLKETKKLLKQLQDADEERKRQAQIEAGQHQQVIDELRPKAQRVETLEAVLEEYLALEMADIPEDKHTLIPEGDVTVRLKWIKQAKAAGLFGQQQRAPITDAGVTGDRKQPDDLTAEEKRTADKFGIPYDKFKANRPTNKG